jgi:endo-1,4-beta-mannosidase
LVITTPAIWDSQADFIDLHLYPGFELDLNQYAENFGMLGVQERPIIMGEFGAARSSYGSVSQAARALRDWQVESCDNGFDGWLLWTWDTEEQGGFCSGLAEEGQFNRELAPVHRPDPCAPG